MADEPNGNIAPASTSAPADWRTFMTDDLKADPVVSKWAEKASEKDVPSLIKGYANVFTKQGNAIHLPGKDAKPEEVSALKQKLYDAGVFPAPPKDPKEYGVLKPEGLPDGLQWSDDLSNKFATTLHKHGVPKAAVADLMALHLEALGGTVKGLQVDRDAALATLKAEHGEKFEERKEMVKRMMAGIVQSPEELAILEESGLADHPKFLSTLMRLAPLAMQDSSFLESVPRTGGEMTGEQAREEYAKVLSDPTHPMHEALHRRDKKAEEYVDELYRKAYGNEKVVI